MERALRRLKDMVASGDDEPLDFDTFDGASACGEDVVIAANTAPFLSAKRLVVVRDVERMSPEGQAALIEYARDPSPTACLVLVAGSLAKTSRLYKALHALGVVSEYQAPKRSELPGWVAALVRSKGHTITRAGAEALIRAVGKDLRALETEVDKVIAFVGEKKELDVADVEAVVAQTAPTSVFDFLDALGARNSARALVLLDELLETGESPAGMLALCVGRLRVLIGIQSLTARGATVGEMMRELRLADWQLRNMSRQSDRFHEHELVDALRDAADAEKRMKTSQGDPGLVLERWVVGVCDRSTRLNVQAR